MKKRLISLLLVLTFVVCSFQTFAFAASNKTVLRDTILYNGPGINYTPLGYLHSGETFVQLHPPYNNYTYGYADTDTQIYAYYNEIMDGYVDYRDIS